MDIVKFISKLEKEGNSIIEGYLKSKNEVMSKELEIILKLFLKHRLIEEHLNINEDIINFDLNIDNKVEFKLDYISIESITENLK